MAILVSCACGRDFLTDDDNAGRGTRCVDCRRLLDVPIEQPRHDDRALDLDPTIAPFSGRAISSFILGASSLALMFVAGLPAIGLGIAAIADIRRSRGRLRGVWMAMAGLALGTVGSTVMSGLWISRALNYVNTSAHETQCAKNIKEFFTVPWRSYGSSPTYPARAIFDKQGQPLLSWRVAILPSLGPESQALYKQFHLKEPWDSPHNLTLLDKMPAVFRCPALRDTRPGMTTYQLLVGPGTAFDGRKPVRWEDFNTKKLTGYIVIEADKPVPWTAPVDVLFDPENPLAMRGDHHSGWYHTSNVNGDVDFHECGEVNPTLPFTTKSAPALKTKTNSPAKSKGR